MNKQIILAMGVTLTVILVVILFTSLGSKKDDTLAVSDTTNSDMSNHHSGSSQANDKTFNNLVGKPAPDFSLEDFNGKKNKLSDLKGKNVVLFFSEGVMCYPSCWNQIAAFAKDNAFNNEDTVTLTITVDKKGEWHQAVDKMPEIANATVLFDENKNVSIDYGVLTLSSSMHRGQYPGHTYLLIRME
jgi:peroxiredoxin